MIWLVLLLLLWWWQSGGVYGAFETLLAPLLEYDDLKPEVFQLFREVGNAMAFLRDLSDTLDLADVMALIQVRTTDKQPGRQAGTWARPAASSP